MTGSEKQIPDKTSWSSRSFSQSFSDLMFRDRIYSPGNRKSSLRDTISSLEDRKSSPRDRISSLEDRKSSLRDRISSLGDRKSSLRDRISMFFASNSRLLARGSIVKLLMSIRPFRSFSRFLPFSESLIEQRSLDTAEDRRNNTESGKNYGYFKST